MEHIDSKNEKHLNITVSIVVPVYKGEKYLAKLVHSISQLRAEFIRDNAPISIIEAIFVNDNAIDDSKHVLEKLSFNYHWLKVITLSRNYGQHAATIAGIGHSQGDWLVTLDEDLQHDPKEIKKMLFFAVNNYADIVYANPLTNVHGSSWRDKSSLWAKQLIAFLSGIKEIHVFNSYRLIRGSIARAAASVCSSKTYLDVALTWFSNSILDIDISMRDDRYVESRKSGYTFFSLIEHGKKLTVNSNINFALSGIVLGFFAMLISLLLIIWGGVAYVFFPESINVPGWTSLIAIISFFSGVIIAIICIILEYISILLVEKLGKPVFFTIDRNNDRVLIDWLNENGNSFDILGYDALQNLDQSVR